jgi:hypothetical protein
MKIAELLGGVAMEWAVTIEERDELGEVRHSKFRAPFCL